MFACFDVEMIFVYELEPFFVPVIVNAERRMSFLSMLSAGLGNACPCM